MPRRIRVYLTLSLKDADLLADLLDMYLATGNDFRPEENAPARFEKMHQRLVELTEAQRPNLAEGMFDGPPDDYDEGGT